MTGSVKQRVLSVLSSALSPGQECYLVGGAIRDTLLGRPVCDFDFAAPFDPTAVARTFAGRWGGTWFFLDEGRRQSRVAIKVNGKEITCDFAPFRDADLAGDLRLRDFTINAMATRVDDPSGKIIDPLDGREDVKGGWLRACSPGVFADDPLRVLKGIRHATVLGFRLEVGTRGLMAEAGEDLGRIKAERLRAEMAAIFSVPDPAPGLTLLQDFGLGVFFFGTPYAGGFGSAVGLVRRAQEILRRLSDKGDNETWERLQEPVEGGIDRASLLRLAVFLRGFGPDAAKRLCARVGLGRKATAVLLTLSTLPEERAARIGRLPGTRRGRALWALAQGPDPWLSLLFLGTLGGRPPEEVVPDLRELFADLGQSLLNGRIPDIVNGEWIRRELCLPEGPAVGRTLTLLRREEIEGRVRSAAEARKFLKSLRQKMIDKKSGEPL